MVARRRPTLPHLKMQYHRRWSVSRPSSGWDRVYHLRDDHRATMPDPEYDNRQNGCWCWGFGDVCVLIEGRSCAVWRCARLEGFKALTGAAAVILSSIGLLGPLG